MPLTDCPKLQPHDLDAEQAILGAILLDPPALSRAQELLSTSDFYDSRHRRIFDAMADLAGRDEGLDLLTVGDHLERKGELDMIGGRGTLAEFLMTIASSSNIGHHARIVRDHAILRRLITFSAEISRRAYGKDSAAELLQDAQRDLHQLASSRDDRSWCPLANLVCETVAYVDQVSKRSTALVGIPTGYQSLNSLLGVWGKPRSPSGPHSQQPGRAIASACCPLRCLAARWGSDCTGWERQSMSMR
jgi:replicative DNA helicase